MKNGPAREVDEAKARHGRRAALEVLLRHGDDEDAVRARGVRVHARRRDGAVGNTTLHQLDDLVRSADVELRRPLNPHAAALRLAHSKARWCSPAQLLLRGLRNEEIADLLAVNLDEGHLYRELVRRARRCDALEHVVDHARNDAARLSLRAVAHHCPRLATAGLAVRQHCNVVAIEALRHQMPRRALVHCALRRRRRKHTVEGEWALSHRPRFNDDRPFVELDAEAVRTLCLLKLVQRSEPCDHDDCIR